MYPSGFRAYSNEMVDAIKSAKQAYGLFAEELILPCVDWTEALLSKGGGENDKLMYKIGDQRRALRFDLTVPLARYVFMNQHKVKINSSYFQVGPVWRGDRPQRGRLREFYQADFDIVRCNDTALAVESVKARIEDLLRLLEVEATIMANPARGQDYYTGDTFEYVTKDGLSVAGGGVYSMKLLGGPDFTCVGGSVGLSRILSLKGE